jgi:hypothetical protein
VRDGYQRGWGLQFSDLAAKAAADPLYQECLRLSDGRSIQGEMSRMNLYLIVRFYLEKLKPGNIIEFGSYRGGSAIFMASACHALGLDTQVFALDTFEGMPPANPAVDAHREHDFSGVDLHQLRTYIAQLGLSNLHLVQGVFEQTCPELLPKSGPFRLAHIDCDIHSAICFAYDSVKPFMVDGGYVVFDDATCSSCLGATEAVEDLVIRRDRLNCEQISPQFVFRTFAN